MLDPMTASPMAKLRQIRERLTEISVRMDLARPLPTERIDSLESAVAELAKMTIELGLIVADHERRLQRIEVDLPVAVACPCGEPAVRRKRKLYSNEMQSVCARFPECGGGNAAG